MSGERNSSLSAYLIALETTTAPVENGVIHLNQEQFTIGRAPEANFAIVSPVISRIHALFRRGKQWTVSDNKSLNGVYVNNARLEPHRVHPLKDGDLIAFGVATKDEDFGFRFSTSIEGRIHKRRRVDTESPNIPNDNSALRIPVSFAREKERLEERLRLVERQLVVKSQVETTLRQELVRVQGTLRAQEDEVQRVRAEMRAEFEDELRAVAIQAKGRAAAGSSSKTDNSEDGLLAEKRKLEQIVAAKENHLKILRHELQSMALGRKKSDEEAVRWKQDTLGKLTRLLETELECCICSELLVQAVVLNCSHSFCSACITEWSAKKGECPVCRSRVLRMNPSVTLDAIIDYIVDSWCFDLKGRRTTLVAQRKRQPHRPQLE